jgi:signal transduction histidine kinase
LQRGVHATEERPARRRILIVDDNPAIHDDFRKILGADPGQTEDLARTEIELFGAEAVQQPVAHFDIEFALQGQEALGKVQSALQAGCPFAVAFVDVRMPPGWDGVETVSRLWQVQPDLQVVICTAYSDHCWAEIGAQAGASENLLCLKKPFDNIEVLQLAFALSRKWELNRRAEVNMEELRAMAARRTQQLQSANEDLQREIQERRQTERLLLQAQKMEAIGQLAAGLAHDFNNILTVIHGHASILQLRLGDEGAHAKPVCEIRHAAERAANLVRQLLTFSRKQVLQFRGVELPEVLRSVGSMLRQLVGEHIVLEIQCQSGLPPVYADRGMIEQIIVNLTINARDAMPRGGKVLIRARTELIGPRAPGSHPESRPGRFVSLLVEDNGVGMDAETLNHLFEPFYTTKETGKGTGLGLATVYGIVKQHRGWIEVRSTLNVGTAFQIYLPVADGTAARPGPEPHCPTEQYGTETILLAEDDPALREIVAEVLSLRGYRVMTAASGPAALELGEGEQSLSLLLTDMIMPGGLMGTDVAQRLKRFNPQLKVLYTTGYSPGFAAGSVRLEEGINFIAKPYSPNKLAELVRRTLDGAGVPEA